MREVLTYFVGQAGDLLFVSCWCQREVDSPLLKGVVRKMQMDAWASWLRIETC